jgi:hypothetical protein
MLAGVPKVSPTLGLKKQVTMLANSFAHVSTDAAVGTDQDKATFWGMIQENFIHRGGGPVCTSSNSLQNCYNKV